MKYSTRKSKVVVPYNLITFFRFCTSSHHNITHGLNNPITKNKKEVSEISRMNNLKWYILQR